MPIIIFDFDDTLFDTKRFKLDIFEAIRSEGFEDNTINETYLNILKTDTYNFEKHIKALEDKSNTSNTSSLLKNLMNLPYPTYVFEGVPETLAKLKENYKLVLLTKGDEFFQKFKLEKTDLNKFFASRDVYVVSDDKANAASKMELDGEVYFVNNNPKENAEVAGMFPNFKYILVSPENPVSKVLENL